MWKLCKIEWNILINFDILNVTLNMNWTILNMFKNLLYNIIYVLDPVYKGVNIGISSSSFGGKLQTNAYFETGQSQVDRAWQNLLKL